MFNNPLKYQQGGSTQNAMQQLVAWLVQNTGLDEGQISQRLNQILSDDTAKQELVNNLQNMQKGDQNAAQNIIGMFVPQNAKFGGKIQDFICKHGKGGKAGCGCKEEGGNIEKAQRGLNAITPEFKYLGKYSVQDKFNPRINQVAWHGYEVNGENIAVPTKQGGHWSGMNYDSVYNNEGEKTMSRSMFNNLEDFYTRALPESNQVKTLDQEKLAGMENGGRVLKGQRGLSSGRFDIPFGAYMKAYFNKRSTPNVGAATNRSFGYSTSNGNEYYLEDANVGRNSVDTWVNVTPQKDTVIMQKLPSDHINDLEDYQMEAIMQRMRPDIKRVNNQENGGKVEKAEAGMSKLEALKKAKETHGYNNSQARLAYTNVKNALRGQGLRGRELRQRAREMISKTERQKIEAVDPNSTVKDFNAPTLPNWSNLPEQKLVGDLTPRMTNNYDSLTFSNAFRVARNKAGGDNGIFNWRGGKYTTALGNTDNAVNNTANSVYNMPGLEPVVINNPEIEIPEYEPLQIESVSTPFVSEIMYPGLRYMIEEKNDSIDSSWPISQWMQKQQEDSKKIVFGPYGIRDKQPRVLTVTSPSLYTPSPMAFETGGKVEKAQEGEKKNDTPYNGTISQGKPRSKFAQAIDNNSKARNFVKGAKQFVKSPMVKWPLAGALAYGAYHLGLTPIVQAMGDELAPYMAPYLFPFLSQMRPKFILDTMNPMKEPPKVEKPSDVFWAVPSNENGGSIEKAQDRTKTSLSTNILKRTPPRIYSSNPLNPSNSWRFIVENFDKEHPDSSIVAPRIMGGEHIYTRTYDRFGIPHTTVNDNSLQSDASEIFNIYRDAQKASQEDNSWGQPNTIYNVK